jgi:hypothetical protein
VVGIEQQLNELRGTNDLRPSLLQPLKRRDPDWIGGVELDQIELQGIERGAHSKQVRNLHVRQPPRDSHHIRPGLIGDVNAAVHESRFAALQPTGHSESPYERTFGVSPHEMSSGRTVRCDDDVVKRVSVPASRAAAAALAVLLMSAGAAAQELDPGAYWPIPTGVNVLTVVNSFNWGDVAFDPSAPIDEASATIDTVAFAFTRAFSLAGRSANAAVVLPVIGGHVEGLYLGEPAQVGRFGLGDPRLKLAINLYGAPAMGAKAFASYHQGAIVGVGIAVAPPLGQYDSTKLINLGTNRWSFKPEIGVSQTFGRWVVEMMAGVWLFTDNTNFVGERTREQDPIAATQVHVSFRFSRGVWLAADANYFTGGRTTIGGVQNLDLQRNSRVGATFSSALDRSHAVRLSVSRGAYTTIGANFTSIAASYSYVWMR